MIIKNIYRTFSESSILTLWSSNQQDIYYNIFICKEEGISAIMKAVEVFGWRGGTQRRKRAMRRLGIPWLWGLSRVESDESNGES